MNSAKVVVVALACLAGCTKSDAPEAQERSSVKGSAGFPDALQVKVTVSSKTGERDSKQQKATFEARLPRTNKSKYSGIYQLGGAESGIAITDASLLETATGEGNALDTMTTPLTKLDSAYMRVEVAFDKGSYRAKVRVRASGVGTQTIDDGSTTKKNASWPVDLDVEFPDPGCSDPNIKSGYLDVTGTPGTGFSLKQRGSCAGHEFSYVIEAK